MGRVSRRILTLTALFVPLVVLVIVGFTVHVPFVAMGPGPTFNTLGDASIELDDGEVVTKPVVAVSAPDADETSGHLNMTTVAVRDHLTLFDALGLWADGDNGVVPREEVYPPGKSQTQIQHKNEAEFRGSERSAQAAALNYLGLSQVTVKQVTDDSKARGILEEGDVIVALNGDEVTSSSQLADSISEMTPGEDVEVSFRPGGGGNGVDTTATITLTEAAQSSGQSSGRSGGGSDSSAGSGSGDSASPGGSGGGALGIVVADDPPDDVDIEFNLSDVGGPSAGLMFSLSVIDQLSPGELSGGRFVAGTGTIAPSGHVGPIGGIPYKMRAARDAGASVFLVPDGNCAQAKRHAPDGLTLVRVDDLGDAVSGLEAIDAGKSAPAC